MKIFRSEIRGVGRCIPEKIVTNDDLAQLMDTNDEWIRARTGIETRHIADVSLATSDLGAGAAQKALENAGWQASDVDLIIAATLSPDNYFPGVGMQIQAKLGLNNIPALDIRGQCSGFTWSMTTADSFIKSGQYKKILVIGCEIHSKVIEFSDIGRNVSVLFGDAGGALCLEAVECASVDELPRVDNNISGIIDNYMGSDGSHASSLAIKVPGNSEGRARYITEEDVRDKSVLPFMDGPLVFKNAIKRMSETVEALMTRNNLSIEQLDLLIPHQANLRINETLRERLNFPAEKTVSNIQKYANTTAATLPLCMVDAVEDGRLKKGTLAMTVAFGSGFSWGGNLFRW